MTVSSKHPILCIFAHPDDEAFGPSGTIAKYAKEKEIYLIYVTDGDDRTNGFHKALPAIRSDELQKSAKILGVKKVFFLGFKDGTLCNNIYHEAVVKIQKIINKICPDSLLTFEERGCSGHIDHIFCSMVSSCIFRKTPGIKKILYFCFPKTQSALMKDYFIYFPPGFSKDKVDLVENVSDYWNQKVAAIKSHVSQKKDGNRILKLIMMKKFLRLAQEEYFLVQTKH